MTSPRFRLSIAVAVVAAVVLVGFTVWLLGGWSQGYTRKAIDDIVIVAVSLVALWFSILAARAARGRVRAAWWALVLGLVAWNIGELIWTYDELVIREIPFPSIADAFFLAFPVGACVALLLLWNRREQGLRGLILLDGLIVAGSLFIVSWLLVMGEIYQSGAASKLEFFLALAYPVADLAIVTISAVVLVSADPGQRVVMTLLTVGLICMAVADSGYAYLSTQRAYLSGDLVDIGWVAGLGLLTVAAAVTREGAAEETPDSQIPGWASVWLPYAPLLVAAGVLAVKPPTSATLVPVLLAGALLFLAVLARQYLAVRDNRRLLADVAEQALRDPLTGLGNRTLFSDRLDHALKMRARHGGEVGVLILDLDDFKGINDTLGHAAGDELLRHAGRRIAGAIRDGDTVARLGGDEFAVIIEGQRDLSDTARRLMDAFDGPVAIDGRDLSMRPSVGLAVASADTPDTSADELLKQADLAMYAAKRSRLRGPTTRGAAGLTRMPGAVDDGDEVLLRQLRRAVEQRELTLLYQPKFHLASGALVGVEALLRWPHPERGVMTPDEFLPLVRLHDLIDPVTEFVVGTALDDARAWRSAGVTVPVAVNLFPPSLAVTQLPDRLSAALAARGLDSAALTVEITEDVLLDDLERTRKVLGELRKRGISVAIDDFGSGYSALWYLRDLPVDEVKLDRSFIAPIAQDPRAGAVARAVIDLAHVLLMKTVAEGVENRETADWLRRHGCDIVQGYYFSPPLTAAEVLSLSAPVSARSS